MHAGRVHVRMCVAAGANAVPQPSFAYQVILISADPLVHSATADLLHLHAAEASQQPRDGGARKDTVGASLAGTLVLRRHCRSLRWGPTREHFKLPSPSGQGGRGIVRARAPQARGERCGTPARIGRCSPAFCWLC